MIVQDSFQIRSREGVMVFQIKSASKSLTSIIKTCVDKNTVAGFSPALQEELEAVIGGLIKRFGDKVRAGLM